jgi:hypothetical protein
MWFFKKSTYRPIPANACWGHLVHNHDMDVDTLVNHMRCVMKEGEREGKKVTFMRIFDLRETKKQMIEIVGWESFDQHPELIIFEGYYTKNDQAFLERKLR